MKDKIEANYRNLDRVSGWISNCDTKAGIVLTFNGLLFTYLITKIPEIKKIIMERCVDFPSFILYTLFFTYAVMVYISMSKSLKTLYPKIKASVPSIFFFHSISQMDLESFKKEMTGVNSDRILEELINQTHINSKIASTKFIHLQAGMKYLFYSLLFWVLSLLSMFLML